MSSLQALELNGRDLLGRNVKLDPAKERGAYTPASGYGLFPPMVFLSCVYQVSLVTSPKYL